MDYCWNITISFDNEIVIKTNGLKNVDFVFRVLKKDLHRFLFEAECDDGDDKGFIYTSQTVIFKRLLDPFAHYLSQNIPRDANNDDLLNFNALFNQVCVCEEKAYLKIVEKFAASTEQNWILTTIHSLTPKTRSNNKGFAMVNDPSVFENIPIDPSLREIAYEEFKKLTQFVDVEDKVFLTNFLKIDNFDTKYTKFCDLDPNSAYVDIIFLKCYLDNFKTEPDKLYKFIDLNTLTKVECRQYMLNNYFCTNIF